MACSFPLFREWLNREFGDLRIGRNAANALDCGELLIYEGSLDDEQMAQVFGYLNGIYGIY